ncbi:hypothetical protein [Mesorhizobium sp.]|nr:hypothetical protein [Mesorhizobium sp.]
MLKQKDSIGPKSGNRFWGNPMLKQKDRAAARREAKLRRSDVKMRPYG